MAHALFARGAAPATVALASTHDAHATPVAVAQRSAAAELVHLRAQACAAALRRRNGDVRAVASRAEHRIAPQKKVLPKRLTARAC